MRDKRPVDELSLEELEQILAVRRRQDRMNRFRQSAEDDRRLTIPTSSVPMQHERAVDVPAPLAPVTYDITRDAPRFDDDPEAVVNHTPVYVSDTPTFVDEDIFPKEMPLAHRRQSQPEVLSTRRRVLNAALLGLEVVIIGALAIVLYRGFIGLQNIQDNTSQTQRELAAIQQQGRVTPSPTPILSVANYVLPGGHTPPDENGLSAFNLLEIEAYVPENIRPVVSRQLFVPPAFNVQPLSNEPVALDIPAIGISNVTIVKGDSWEALKAGVGYSPGSGLPGTNQNVVLTGHNDIYGEIFRYLEDLERGDEIHIRDASGRVHTYRVRQTEIVDPDAVWVLDRNLGAQVTLITCHPYQVDTQRLIVFADLVQ
jgi:sortase A